MAFVGINVRWDAEADAVRFLETYRVPYPVGRDAGGAVGRRYGVEATPTTYVIGRDGRVAASTTGAVEAADLDRLVEAALARP